jgi:hypothetical protein
MNSGDVATAGGGRVRAATVTVTEAAGRRSPPCHPERASARPTARLHRDVVEAASVVHAFPSHQMDARAAVPAGMGTVTRLRS